MSIGYLIKEEDPVVWRGLMVMKALEQLTRQVDWSGLDVLVIDMPPGTGDTQLTLTQTIPLSGAVIISTPQDVALLDAKKGVYMFQKVDVPVGFLPFCSTHASNTKQILGIIQNMSYFACSKCGEKTYIFGQDGVKKTAEELGLDLLGDVPLHPSVCETSDAGAPITISQKDSMHAQVYRDMAAKIASKLVLSKPGS